MSIDIRLDYGWFLAVFCMLLLFGIAYNWAISKLGRRLEGFTSLSVAFGVLGTLALIAIISWQVAAICLAGFFASGLPMVAGSVMRYMQRREDARSSMISEARDAE
jgi:MFS family permease